MNGLKRENRIVLVSQGDNRFSIEDRDGNIYKDADSDYIIYMRNIIFRRDGKIQGIYLGELEIDNVILKGENKRAYIEGNIFKVDGVMIKSARMVAVNNKNEVLVIIPNE